MACASGPDISRSRAYELIEFARAYPEVSGTGHFASVAEAMRALPAPAPDAPEVTPDSPELAARVAEMKRLQAECRRDRAEIERLQHATHELQVENNRIERNLRRRGLIDAKGRRIGA